jgi:signal transduction histidine kinase/ActR/RegA family two-component response regulator
LEEVAAIIINQLNDAVPIDTSISISLRDGIDSSYMRAISVSPFQEGHGEIKESKPEIWNFSLSDYPATANVIKTQKPLIININDSEADPNEIEYMVQENVGTLVILPLVLKGQTIGVIELETWKEEYKYTSDEINLLSTLANQAAISLENARLYEEQFETAEQLRELDQLKSQFLANMSHELRTPLNSIIGFSRVIMKGIDGPVTDLQQQDLSAIYNAGQHLLKMINDILDVSKIDAGKMELAFEDVNILDIINSVMSTARGLIKDKPIELLTAIEDDLTIITGDSTRIRQILLNLISNAAKFTERGSITVTARQQLNVSGNPEVYIGVSDTGIGIPPEDQKKLFEPFVQVDGSPTRATGGTGLGLSITRMLVELHNGEIGLESEVNKGSTFFFTLPIGNTTSPPPAVEGKTSILAIDDDIQVVQLYERYLNETAFQIVPLNDPSSALLYAREIQPFAITLDILFPNHDGWQLLKELKTNPETKGIPVVICSFLDESEKGAEMGADDYLVKPILADDFVNAMNRIWEKKVNNE